MRRSRGPIARSRSRRRTWCRRRRICARRKPPRREPRATWNGCAASSRRTRSRSNSSTRRWPRRIRRVLRPTPRSRRWWPRRAHITVAEQRAAAARGAASQARAGLANARTAPQQLQVTEARANSADARVKQAEAALKQAELNLEHTTVKAPSSGVVSRKSVEPGQVVQPGQPLMALVDLNDVWVTANFKETQLADDAARTESAHRRRRPGRQDLRGARRQHRAPPRARSSASCPRRTRPATTSRSCSACRCGSSSSPARIRITCSGPACRSPRPSSVR